jgi:hypothetical protein
MDAAAIAAAAQAANQAGMFGAVLRMNMANSIAAQLSLYIHDSLNDGREIDDKLINRIADCSVRLADAVMRRCSEPPARFHTNAIPQK